MIPFALKTSAVAGSAVRGSAYSRTGRYTGTNKPRSGEGGMGGHAPHTLIKASFVALQAFMILASTTTMPSG
jgi:hypothetical protein